MRILHTSDWHLGRSFHREGMLEHQAAYVDHLLEVVESERQDTFVFCNIKNGNKIEGLFPMDADWKAKYNQWVADGEPEI